MSKQISLTRVTILCAVLVGGLLLVSPLVGVGAADNGTANMTVTADTETVGTNQPTNVTVQATDAQNGISAYNFTLTVDDQVATITEVTTLTDGEDGPVTNISYGPNESNVTVTTALLDATHEPAPTTDLVNVTVQGDANGTTEVKITNTTELADTNVETYNITQVTNTSLNVRPTTSIEITPNVSELSVEERTEVAVVATETPLGVSSYNSSVIVDGNATIENVSIPGQSDVEVMVTANGTQANVTVSNITQTQATNVELFTLSVEGTAPGPANISVAPIDGLTGTNGTAYYPTTGSVAMLSVASGDSDESGGGASQAGGGGGTQPLTEEEALPLFEIETVTLETPTATTGETLDISTTITNTGEAGGNQAIELQIENETIVSESLTIREGEEEGITFSEVSVPDVEGTVMLTVVTENESVTETLTVEVPEEETNNETTSETNNSDINESTTNESENTSVESSETTDGDVPGFTVSLFVIALIVIGAGLRHQQS